jgi:peptide-methionine (S)-S-oxide reductase
MKGMIKMTAAVVAAILIAATGAAISGEGAKPEAEAPRPDKTEVAIFAGGCFWCMEPPYDKLEGVISTTSGYAGGKTVNPTYEQVSSGETGHIEVVRIEYDPAKVSYDKLLEVFWRNIDPLDAGGQFCDRGAHYRSAILYLNEDQKRAAEASKARLEGPGGLGKPVATELLPVYAFYAAEAYHQDYYKKNPVRYRFYRMNCGRDARLKALWGDSATN